MIDRIMPNSRFVAAACGISMVAIFASGPAQAAPEETVIPAFSRSTPSLAWYQTPNRKHTEIKGDEAKTLAAVEVDLANDSNVLVQFSSQLSTVVAAGCPCSARASLQVDDEEPVVIKRVNLGSVNTSAAGKYQVDRKAADGTFVYSLPKGRHTISLIVQRIEGDSEMLYAFYANLQAMPIGS